LLRGTNALTDAFAFGFTFNDKPNSLTDDSGNGAGDDVIYTWDNRFIGIRLGGRVARKRRL
jgi:hypothetical protein